jgi:uncharacterized lipoprotein YmbA
MKNKSCLTALLILLATIMAGCSSSQPNNYYLLSTPPGPTPAGTQPSVGIGPIEVPQYLKRNSMVYGEPGNQLHISDHERWAEPLSDGIQRVLSLNLASQLDTQSIQTYPWSSAQTPAYGVEVTLLALDAGADTATLVAEWRVRKPREGREVGRRISRIERPLSTPEFTGAVVAPAYSELLFRLSQEIAAVISTDLEQATSRQN